MFYTNNKYYSSIIIVITYFKKKKKGFEICVYYPTRYTREFTILDSREENNARKAFALFAEYLRVIFGTVVVVEGSS